MYDALGEVPLHTVEAGLAICDSHSSGVPRSVLPSIGGRGLSSYWSCAYFPPPGITAAKKLR